MTGCTFDGNVSSGQGGVDPRAPDAAPGPDTGPGPDADNTAQLHLLLSEVKNTISGTEFIEIYNPTAAPIALDDYYLADCSAYASLPTAEGPGPNPSVINSDFVARFPAGASIASGQALVVGINASGFSSLFGFNPDFKIGNSGPGTDMRSAFPSSIGSQSSLTDGGEGIALLYWDGTSDLVVDVDLLIAGANTGTGNALVNKTGLSIDGPDIGDIETSYKTDLASMDDFPRGTILTESFIRVSLEQGFEARAGTGNGRFGHDESTEDTASTWGIAPIATPGVVPASLGSPTL